MNASPYKPEMVEQARKLCELGATDREVAEFLGIAVRTIFLWKHDHPEFAAAMKVGKEHADERVVQSLYKRATGYSYDAVKIMTLEGYEDVEVEDAEGKKSTVRRRVTRVHKEPYVEHVPPDTTACIFWSKNRMPDQWRDVKAIEHSGAIRHSHVEELSDAELERIARGGSPGAAKAKGGKKAPAAVH